LTRSRPAFCLFGRRTKIIGSAFDLHNYRFLVCIIVVLRPLKWMLISKQNQSYALILSIKSRVIPFLN
jgi:hypothetical protein